MRGNSGFLRWLPCGISSNKSRRPARSSALSNKFSMDCSRSIAFATISLVLIAVVTPSTNAGPAHYRRTRMTHDFYSDFEVTPQNDTGSSGTCLQNGVQVVRSSVQCEKKSGCREIQKTGYCCPDYQCDCERGNRTYSNGEKLFDHENPCNVCYCQGGEITCIDLKCYVRNDCEPKYTPGICCPEYDNCPPLEDVKPSVHKDNSPAEKEAPTGRNPGEAAAAPVQKQDNQPPNGNPLGIKIKEITKAEEIRIVDEKPKPSYPIIKPSDNSNSNPPKSYPPRAQNRQESTNGNSVDNNQSGETKAESPSSELVSETSAPSSGESHEMLNKLENTDVNYIDDEDGTKSVRHTNVSIETQAENNSSEYSNENATKVSSNLSTGSTEVSSNESGVLPQDDPSAGDAGSKVVVVDQNGQKKPFTVFGVEGLQRGDDNDELTDYDEKKVTSKRSDTNSTIVGKTPDSDDLIEPEADGQDYELNGNDTEIAYDCEENCNEPIASSSDDFVRVIVTTRKPNDFGSGVEGSGSSENSTFEVIYDTVFYTAAPDDVHIHDETNSSETVYDTVFHSQEETNNDSSSSSIVYDLGTSYHPNPVHPVETAEYEQNPAYPTIKEEDLSVHKYHHTLGYDGEDTEPSHASHSTESVKILHEVDEFRSNASQATEPEASSVAPQEWLKDEDTSASKESTEVNVSSEHSSQPTSSSSEVGQRAEPTLVPEWERNSNETSSAHNETTSKDTHINTSNEETLLGTIDLDEGSGIESGSGSSALEISRKDREPTTPRVSRFLNNDEIETISDKSDESPLDKLQHDPKQDVESLKIEDSDVGGVPIKYTGVNPSLPTTFKAMHSFHRYVDSLY